MRVVWNQPRWEDLHYGHGQMLRIRAFHLFPESVIKHSPAHDWVCSMPPPRVSLQGWAPVVHSGHLHDNSPSVGCLLSPVSLPLSCFIYLSNKLLALGLLLQRLSQEIQTKASKCWGWDLKPGLWDSRSLRVSLTRMPLMSFCVCRVADVLWRRRGLEGVRQMHYIDEISWQLRSYPSYVKGWINWIEHEEI